MNKIIAAVTQILPDSAVPHFISNAQTTRGAKVA
jgi:hypothetical protein